jgi:hypothetical protein
VTSTVIGSRATKILSFTTFSPGGGQKKNGNPIFQGDSLTNVNGCMDSDGFCRHSKGCHSSVWMREILGRVIRASAISSNGNLVFLVLTVVSEHIPAALPFRTFQEWVRTLEFFSLLFHPEISPWQVGLPLNLFHAGKRTNFSYTSPEIKR